MPEAVTEGRVMLHPDIVLGDLLVHCRTVIPVGTINNDWLKCVQAEIDKIESIDESDADGACVLLRLSQFMTEAHQYILKKSGVLCRTCFDETTKQLFLKKCPAFASRGARNNRWELYDDSLYLDATGKKPPLWGTQLWEQSMEFILGQSYVDVNAGGDILCFHSGEGHCLSSITINGGGKSFLLHTRPVGFLEYPEITPSTISVKKDLPHIVDGETIAHISGYANPSRPYTTGEAARKIGITGNGSAKKLSRRIASYGDKLAVLEKKGGKKWYFNRDFSDEFKLLDPIYPNKK